MQCPFLLTFCQDLTAAAAVIHTMLRNTVFYATESGKVLYISFMTFTAKFPVQQNIKIKCKIN